MVEGFVGGAGVQRGISLRGIWGRDCGNAGSISMEIFDPEVDAARDDSERGSGLVSSGDKIWAIAVAISICAESGGVVAAEFSKSLAESWSR